MTAYRVFASIHSDSRSSEIWTTNKNIKTKLVKVTSDVPKSESIIVSHRKIEKNFRSLYNKKDSGRLSIHEDKDSIVISEYYRDKLKISTKQDFKLNIVQIEWFFIYYQLRYLREHPNDVVRITYWLTIIAFVIGFLSIRNDVILFIKFILGIFANCQGGYSSSLLP